MLTDLYIKQFTIIDELHLSLSPGMTVITGETGAGKSIMIDALSLCLGARADTSMIRHGEERCELSACFDLSKLPHVRDWLTTHDFDPDDCILRRTITKEGRSRAYINGQPAPVQQLRELADLLVTIHGQHEHHSLLKRDSHRQLLDDYAQHDSLLHETAQLYTQWQTTQKHLHDLQQLTAEASRLELLRYQVNELDELQLTTEELVQLEKEHKQLASADKTLQACEEACALLASSDTGIHDQLHHVQQLMQPLIEIHPHFANATTMLTEACINAEEAFQEIQHGLEQFDRDPNRLDTIEHRLQAIDTIARKHRVKAKDIPALHTELHDELTQFNDSEERIAALQTELTTLGKTYRTQAKKLSASRHKKATQLAQHITQYLQQLGMPEGKFEIVLTPRDTETPHPHGLDTVEFTVSANPGQPLQGLQKVASGGELSRISLAIQVITAQHQTVPTLLFDEVDVGIGGGTAEIVGKLLKTLGEHAQVLCVTHQPQVAAQGDTHFQVAKSTQKNTTHTTLTTLDREAKIQEIARMLGGVKMTKQTLAHAEEMLDA